MLQSNTMTLELLVITKRLEAASKNSSCMNCSGMEEVARCKHCMVLRK